MDVLFISTPAMEDPRSILPMNKGVMVPFTLPIKCSSIRVTKYVEMMTLMNAILIELKKLIKRVNQNQLDNTSPIVATARHSTPTSRVTGLSFSLALTAAAIPPPINKPIPDAPERNCNDVASSPRRSVIRNIPSGLMRPRRKPYTDEYQTKHF